MVDWGLYRLIFSSSSLLFPFFRYYGLMDAVSITPPPFSDTRLRDGCLVCNFLVFFSYLLWRLSILFFWEEGSNAWRGADTLFYRAWLGFCLSLAS